MGFHCIFGGACVKININTNTFVLSASFQQRGRARLFVTVRPQKWNLKKGVRKQCFSVGECESGWVGFEGDIFEGKKKRLYVRTSKRPPIGRNIKPYISIVIVGGGGGGGGT